MKDEYDFSMMKARKNPYASKLKKPVARLSEDVVTHSREVKIFGRPLMSITGSRFTMEERRVAHAAELFEALRDPRLYAFLDEDPPGSVQALALKLAQSESRLSPGGKEHWLNWVVRVESGAIAGYVQATVVQETGETNVAYVFSPSYQGKGIAGAAVQWMLDVVASQYQARRFVIVTEATNWRSVRLAQRLGFTLAPQDLRSAQDLRPTEVMYWKQARPSPLHGALQP